MLAVSNIAWPRDLDPAAYDTLAHAGVSRIEIAPTRIWPDWRDATDAAINALARELNEAGLACVSFQSLLYGLPDLRIFGTAHERQQTDAHLRRVADMAARIGAGPMVFGSPANRRRGELPAADAFTRAVDFFGPLGDYCAAAGVCLCLEANPPAYGCDFITTSTDAAALVRAVGSPGFGLHLDAACMFLAGEDVAAAIAAGRDVLRHFHASEPSLGSFAAPKGPHAAAARALAQTGWDGHVAIEMRAGEDPLAALAQAIAFVRTTYGIAP